MSDVTRAYRRRATGGVLTTLTWLLALAFFFPVAWMAATAFKQENQAASDPPTWFFTPTLDQFRAVIEGGSGVYVANSAIATGVSTIAMGLLYGTLFNLDIAEFLPYVALGFIIWNLIQGSIIEGADVFMSNEGLIKQLPTPLSVHVYRLVWRQMILFAHNIVIYIGIFIVFPQHLSWTALAAIPALALIAINAVWISLVFGILSTRYRDIAPLLGSLVQLLFFMTPIIWTEKSLAGTGNEDRARIAEINPLYHFLDIVRTPLLGGDQQLYHWVIVLIITVLGWGLALVTMRNYRSRVAYWV